MAAAVSAANTKFSTAAATGAQTTLNGTFGAFLKSPTTQPVAAKRPIVVDTLAKAQSMPSLGPRLPNAETAPKFLMPKHVDYLRCTDKTVSFGVLEKFLYPPMLDNSNSTGRLELFAHFGPTDEEGQLRGGGGGMHVHTDGEINEMIRHDCREALFSLFSRPRNDVEVIVDTLLPTAMSSRYTREDVQALLSRVPCGDDGRMNFNQMQKTILASQRQRLKAIVARVNAGKPIAPPKERPLKVGFQSQAAAAQMEVISGTKTNKNQILGKFKNDQIQELAWSKRRNAYCALVAPLENQNMGRQLSSNVLLVRPPGDVNDRWDRYCALRRTGRSSYIGARNENRYNPTNDEGLSNKHPGVSSLVAASAHGTSAAMQLAA
eukprot:TRINITY_DN55761_c0_g1_i1.p1 TRINITY_DN55761_c0_g1~~TRINITY_DN55761_c0_g1_i1.p1  ORF type:complete len:377 (+),score=53.31 TRINITY_DN55761_c0_g1_i1:310-1440(+)